MRAMPVAIRRVVIAIGTHQSWGCVCKIPAIGVIDIAICIVINAIPGDFTRVRPDVVTKFRMCFVDSRVKHSNLERV